MVVRDRNIKLEEVKEITGFGKTKIYEMMAAGEFPESQKVGSATFWSEVQVLEWQNKIWGHSAPELTADVESLI